MSKMKTYVKFSGTSNEKTLEELRKIAIDMPKVCVIDSILQEELGLGSILGPGGIPGAGGGGQMEDSVDMVMNYFGGPSKITRERCATIISKSGMDLGEYDFAYEWTTKPSSEQITKLENKIAETLKPLKTKYSVKSK